MTERVREQILGYLLGVLDDSEAALVRSRLQNDPVYQRELVNARRMMAKMDSANPDYSPPPGLARRTCDFVFSHARRVRSAAARRWAMTPHAALPTWVGRMGWLDVSVAAVVCAMVGLVILPAIEGTRLQARRNACQDNLRQLGVSLAQYNQRNHNDVPGVADEATLASAGMYSPALVQDGFLNESGRLFSPEPLEADPQMIAPIPTVEELKAACDRGSLPLGRQVSGSCDFYLGRLENGVWTPAKNLCRSYLTMVAGTPSANVSEVASSGGTFLDDRKVNRISCGQNLLFDDGHVEFVDCPKPAWSGENSISIDDDLHASGILRRDSVIVSSDAPPIIFVKGR
jgi:hypothetical protein